MTRKPIHFVWLGLLAVALITLPAALGGVRDAQAANIGSSSIVASPNPVSVGQVSTVTVTLTPAGGSNIAIASFKVTWDVSKFTLVNGSIACGASSVCEESVPGTINVTKDFLGSVTTPSVALTFNVTAVAGPSSAFNVIAATGAAISCSNSEFSDDECSGSSTTLVVSTPATTVTATATTVTTTPTTVTTTPTTVTTTPTTVVPTTVVPPSPGVIRFAQSTSSVSESNPGGKTVTVRRVGGSAGEVSAICTITVIGTATSGLDFTGTVNQTLTWGDGESQNQFCNYELLQDALIENDETIIFALSDGDIQSLRAEIGSPSTHTVTIEDDDETVNPNTPTPTKTPPVYGSPVVSTSTPYPTSTPTVTNTPKPTQSAVPTNTSSAQTHTPTATQTKPASATVSASVSSTATGGTGGTGGNATPRPPSAGTGSDFGGTSTLAALLLVAIGLGISGFAATRVTRK